MKEIPITKGYSVVVDDADYEAVSAYKWSAKLSQNRNGKVWNVYAVRSVTVAKGIRRTVGMHSFIVGTPIGMYTDHINGNGLDNRRSNLRICTNQQNQHNQSPRLGGTSKFKGVSLCKRTGMWFSSIRCNGKKRWLGTFSSEIAAANAYNSAAEKLFGEFSCLNQAKGD